MAFGGSLVLAYSDSNQKQEQSKKKKKKKKVVVLGTGWAAKFIVNLCSKMILKQAVGGQVNTFNTPGVVENCYFLFKEVDDAQKIRRAVIDCFCFVVSPKNKEEEEESYRFLLNKALILHNALTRWSIVKSILKVLSISEVAGNISFVLSRGDQAVAAELPGDWVSSGRSTQWRSGTLFTPGRNALDKLYSSW
ncbi:unnamed protein product [Cochlearia groenlandica]